MSLFPWRLPQRPPRSLYLAGLAGIAGVAIALYLANGRSEAQPLYRMARIDTGAVESVVNASGTLRPVMTVLVGTQISGQIKEILADFNSEVKAGEVIARLDPDVVAARLDLVSADLKVAQEAVDIARAQADRARSDSESAHAASVAAQAEIQRAESGARDAERDLKRKKNLTSSGDVPSAEADRSQMTYDSAAAGLNAARARAQAAAAAYAASLANVKGAEAGIENALAEVAHRQAAVHQAQVDLDHTVIRAPIDGLIIDRNIDVGQTVAASLQAPTLFTIAKDLRHMVLHASVDEADIGRVAIDQQVTFDVDAYPGVNFAGKIVDIRKSPQVLQNVVTYVVVISADNPEQRLLPGMTANARIVVSHEGSVLKAPNAALRFVPASSTADSASADPAMPGMNGRLWRLARNGKPVAVPVKLGVSDGSFTQILAGDVTSGQEVIVGLAASPKSAAH